MMLSTGEDMLNVVVYNNGELELKISVDRDTIWLSQKQIAELFDKDVRTINDHIKFIYKEKELYEDATIRKLRIVQKEGNREVARNVSHYNLDAIISIGYRVNSKKATKFRQWATSVLKEYISNGYVLNREKITQQRILDLENDVKDIRKHIKNNTLELKHGIFYNGEIFDAYYFIVDIIKSATKSITLIDNYIDETTLIMLSKNSNVDTKLITHTISKQLKLDIQKYNKQYKNLEAVINKTFHDRYLIVDETRVYSIGASLKDVGNKTFNVNLMNDFCEDDILRGRL